MDKLVISHVIFIQAIKTHICSILGQCSLVRLFEVLSQQDLFPLYFSKWFLCEKCFVVITLNCFGDVSEVSTMASYPKVILLACRFPTELFHISIIIFSLLTQFRGNVCWLIFTANVNN